MTSNFILYVKDQEKSAAFYSDALGMKPTLHVPGMTEFQLGKSCILGLMPEAGIRRLLGDAIPDPANASGIPRAELYLRVPSPEVFSHRALAAGAKELSPLSPRNWGDLACYLMDPDGHILVFAEPLVAT